MATGSSSSSSRPAGAAGAAAAQVQALSSEDVLDLGLKVDKEFLLLAGKDLVGKTSALVSLAAHLEALHAFDEHPPRIWVLDTENKFTNVWRSWGSRAPRNIVYYHVTSMDQVLAAFGVVLATHSAGDWLFVESMGRIWEYAQSLGYQAVTGQSKPEYLERRRQVAGGKMPPPTPQPDMLWQVTKDAHDAEFLDKLTAQDGLNIAATTTTIRPPSPSRGIRKENQDRMEFRAEHGLDAGLAGAPGLPTYVSTLCLLELERGAVSCRVLRDNNATREESRLTFPVSSRMSWGPEFWAACRTPQEEQAA